MSDELLDRARQGDREAFGKLVEPFRRDLQVHCYRFLGSVHDADDAVQDTLISAWQAIGSFAGRASLSTWLRRLATNRCLNMLRAEKTRAQPRVTDVGANWPQPTRMGEVPWLEPLPDAWVDGLVDPRPGPEAKYEAQESVSLAFIVALQLLPPRQRAALILREVLGYHAAEVAAMLEATEESVSSALKRARATLHAHMPSQKAPPKPHSREEADLAERFARAFESTDLRAILDLVTDDIRISMPPIPYEYVGVADASGFLSAGWLALGAAAKRSKLVPTRANGQPAFVYFVPDLHGEVRHALGLLALTLAGGRVAAITRFDTSCLEFFGSPRTIPAA